MLDEIRGALRMVGLTGGLLSGSALAPGAVIETVDGVLKNANIVEIERSGTGVKLVIPGSRIPLRDVLHIEFAAPRPSRDPFEIVLADGSRVYGRLEAPKDDESIRIVTPLFPEGRDISLNWVRNLRRTAATELPAAVGQSTDVDRLRTRKGATHSGILLAIGPESVRFEDSELGELTYDWPQLAEVEVAAIEQPPEVGSKAVLVSVEGPDGSTVVGALESLDAKQTRVVSPILGELVLPLRLLSGITVRMGRVEYLSDRDPVAVKEGVPEELMDPELFAQCFGWQRDRTVHSLTPLQIGERIFRKGLGVHSESRLTYEVSPADRVFQSWIGLDRTGRPTVGDQVDFGSVVFKVLVDGKEVVNRPMNWQQEAERVEVELAGASRLELLVEMGPGLHILDRANWADARLIRE